MKAQDEGDLKPLAALLRADDWLELRRGERVSLAEIFERGRFRKGRGTRFGTMSAEHRLKIVAEFVRSKQAEGLSQARAIEAAARMYTPEWFPNGDGENQLANYLKGRRGSTNRRKSALAKK